MSEIDLNDPRLSEQERREQTEFWNKRYARAPDMDQTFGDEKSQKYRDLATLSDTDRRAAEADIRRVRQAPGSRAEMVALAQSTRGSCVEQRKFGTPEDLRAAEFEHRRALSTLINHDRAQGHPIADPTRDLNKPGEEPTTEERKRFIDANGRGWSRDNGTVLRERTLSRQPEQKLPMPTQQAKQEPKQEPKQVPEPFDASKVKVKTFTNLADGLGLNRKL